MAEQEQPVFAAAPDTHWLEVLPSGDGVPIPNLAGFVYFDERLTGPLGQLHDPIVGIGQLFDLRIPVEYSPDEGIRADFTDFGEVLNGITRSGVRLALGPGFTPEILSPTPYLDNSLRRNKPPISYKARASHRDPHRSKQPQL